MANQHAHPLIAYEPFKFLFRLAYIGTVVVRLPFWIIAALVQPLKPCSDWTPKQTLMMPIVYAVLDVRSKVGVTQTLSLKGKKEGDRFQVIAPSESDFYRGPLVSDVKPTTIGGTWFPQAPGGDLTSKHVILYFHGGAFAIGDGRTGECGFLGKTLVERGGVDAVLSIQYRLAGYSGLNPFPAAIQDGLTSYLFVLNVLKIPAHHITIAGDSAGANLAIALLRYIEEFGETLSIPIPRCLAVVSPWVAPLDYDISRHPSRSSDYLPTSFLRWGARSYVGHLSNAASHPYVTPLGNPFKTKVPIFVNTGSVEIFFEANKRWANEMSDVEGNIIQLHIEKAACHDTLYVADIVGFEESAGKVAEEIGVFIRKS
ncbi:alpha/beta hydrolase fold-3 domain-containing protein [Hypoxylon trugodes]|uniref:alpha/beta hydrolase fold-3 domain-containing protein n=1 Tax=Hypoxylon trugodes TaxID=326681 RepID=UPI002193C273|nr:alpha/beta hydrolase fold-3 domain-containing protein [Hypoxylon trugodes]KAI1385502.1 alpha/beta hydrolase fold-3 domain-containing protein [Hypoxylon trugodes]